MSRWVFQGVVFDPTDGSLTGPKGAVVLRPKVAALLDRLVQSPHQVVSKEALIEAIWADGQVVDYESGLAAILKSLRDQLTEVMPEPAEGDEFVDVIETLPRRGVRLNAAVEIDTASTSPTPSSAPHSFAEHQPPQSARRVWALWARLFSLLVLVGVAWWVMSVNPRPSNGPESQPSSMGITTSTLAILPFEVYGGPPERAKAQGLLVADALLSELWAQDLSEVVLLGRASVQPYLGRPDPTQELARNLGAQWVVEGRLVWAEETVTLTARLFSAQSGAIVWSFEVDGPVGSGQALAIESLAQAMADALAVPLASDRAID